MMTRVLAAVCCLLLLATSAVAADDAAKCQASKSKLAGTYYACREKAEAAAILKGGTPDFSKCIANFTSKWMDAESKGVGLCPDDAIVAPAMSAFLAGQASEAASIISGAQDVPGCGDGTLNVAGELCDGADLGGRTCASFGFASGTLGCNTECELDLSACTSCAGFQYGGACWFLGATGDTCSTTCALEGLVYDGATRTVAGSEGTNAACQEILDGVGAVGSGLQGDYACDVGWGCNVFISSGFPPIGFRARCTAPTTVPDASGGGALQLVCACRHL
jgi:hypothetical protein